MADIFSRSNKPLKGTNFNSPGRTNTPFGVFLGFVKDNTDVQRMGRLRVWIPEFGSLPEDTDGWITVSYCSPFAGATNPATEDTNNVQSFEGTQTSYGMWFVPPDLENQVLVMFINGDTAKGIWIGSFFQQYMNHMVPAVAASSNTYQYGSETGGSTHAVPTAEYNKWDTSVSDPQRVRRPYSKTKFRGLSNQGLITDPIRGITRTSARREAPSQVYGILTPGPLQKGTTTGRRTGGSSFVMDDSENSEYVQFATKSGAQIKIDETNGFVFLINRDGTSWVQMDKDGNFDIFSAGNMSVRSQKDINFRADRNINFEAGQNIYMKAAKDTVESTTVFTYDVNGLAVTKTIPFWEYKGEGKGDGGNIVIQSLNNLQTTIQNNAFITVSEGNLNLLVNNSAAITTNTGGIDLNSNKGIRMSTGAAFDLLATGKIRLSTSSDISVSSTGLLTLCSDGKLSINSGTNIIVNSDTKIGMSSPEVVIDSASISIGGGTVDIAPPSMPSAGNINTSESAQTSAQAENSEIKPLNDKINILPTWKITEKYPAWVPNVEYRTGVIVDSNGQLYQARRIITSQENVNSPSESIYWTNYVSEDKFVRNSESMRTTVSRLPTFEPCPENANFKLTSIDGYIPPVTEYDNVFLGSGGAGSLATQAPDDSNDLRLLNTDVLGDSLDSNIIGGDMDLEILKCQLVINEGVRYKSYLDTKGLLTGGIGHLLSKPTETSRYPAGTTISKEQVNQWFVNDTASAIRGAQRVVGNVCWDGLNDVRKRALIDLTYNLGEAGLAGFKKFVIAMKLGDFIKAGAELRDSKWFGEVKLRGPRIVSMITTGVDPMDWCKAAKGIV